MIHVGFTGTRHGMTPQQLAALDAILVCLGGFGRLTFRHGDCVGGDEEAHRAARRRGARVEVHPGRGMTSSHLMPDLRAWCEGDVVHPVLTFFHRNRRIVDLSDVVVAAPRETIKQYRGGTWYTISYAEQRKKTLAVLSPRPGGVVIELSGDWKMYIDKLKEMTK
jgi:hypothetical protein